MYPYNDESPLIVRVLGKNKYCLKGIEDLPMDKRQLTILLAGIQALCLQQPSPEDIGLMFTCLQIRGHNEAYLSAAAEFETTGVYISSPNRGGAGS